MSIIQNYYGTLVSKHELRKVNFLVKNRNEVK